MTISKDRIAEAIRLHGVAYEYVSADGRASLLDPRNICVHTDRKSKMGSHEILAAVYEIRGLSDSGGLLAEPEAMEECLRRIYELACEVMDRTGYEPPVPKP